MDSKYPKTEYIEDDDLKRMIEERSVMLGELVKDTKKIKKYDKDIGKLEEQYNLIVNKVDISEFTELAKPKREQIKRLMQEVQLISEEANKKREKAIPEELMEKFTKAKSEKEKLEMDRRKLGLQIQKKKDRVTGKIEKLKPKLDQYEFVEKVVLEKDKVAIKIASHLDNYIRTLEKPNK